MFSLENMLHQFSFSILGAWVIINTIEDVFIKIINYSNYVLKSNVNIKTNINK